MRYGKPPRQGRSKVAGVRSRREREVPMARCPSVLGAYLLAAACSAGSTGGTPSPGGAGSGSVSNGSTDGSASAACSTDGSDQIVVGTYSHDWNTPSNAFSVDVMMPDCTFCEDSYHVDDPTAPTQLRRMPGTWSSAWSSDRTRIAITLSDGMPFGTVSPDGLNLTSAAGANAITLSRIKDLGSPELKTCDGYTVISASNYFQ
jgi:hypothetical protein